MFGTVARKGLESSPGLRGLHPVPIDLLPHQRADDAVAGVAVAVGVDGLGHAVVGDGVVEESAHLIDNQVVVGAHEMDGAALEGFWALGGVAHDEDGLPEAGGLFLDAAGVGEDHGRFLHQVHELEVLQGFDEEEVGMPGRGRA